MARDWKIGDRVSFLRMNNKAIKLTGAIHQINGDGKTVNVKVDGTADFIETAHVNDVCALTTPEQDAATLRGVGIAATATSTGVKVDVPAVAPVKSFVTVNGKPI